MTRLAKNQAERVYAWQLLRFYIQRVNLNKSLRSKVSKKQFRHSLPLYVSPEIAAFFLSNQQEQLPAEPENLQVR